MAFVTINGVSYEASEQVAQAVGVLQATADKAEKALKELETVDGRIESAKEEVRTEMQATIDTKEGEIDALKAKIPTADQLDAMVNERQEVLDKAKKLAPKANFDGKSLVEVRSEVVLACCKDLENLDGKSEDYIFARFDSLEVPAGDGKGSLNRALGQATQDLGEPTSDQVEEARKKKMQANRDRGMRPRGMPTMNQMQSGTMSPETMSPGNGGSMMPRMHGNPPNNMGGMNK